MKQRARGKYVGMPKAIDRIARLSRLRYPESWIAFQLTKEGYARPDGTRGDWTVDDVREVARDHGVTFTEHGPDSLVGRTTNKIAEFKRR